MKHSGALSSPGNAAQPEPQIKTMQWDVYLTEQGYDGDEIFATAMSAVAYTASDDVVALMRIAKKNDGVLFLAGVPLSAREEIVGDQHLGTLSAMADLLRRQAHATGNKIILERQKEEVRKRSLNGPTGRNQGGGHGSTRDEEGSCVIQ